MLYSDLSFLLERMKINKSAKLVCNVQDNKKLCSTIVALKQVSNHG